MTSFDPRFNPAFQPGFTAAENPQRATGETGPHTAEARRTETGKTDQPAVMDVAPSPSPLPPLIIVPAASAVPAEVLPMATVHADASAGAGSATSCAPSTSALLREPDSFWRRTNRFVLVLGALSVLFAVAGFAVLQFEGKRMSQLATTGGGSSTDYYFFQAFTIGATMLIVLGLATVTATVLLFAARSLNASRPTQGPVQPVHDRAHPPRE